MTAWVLESALRSLVMAAVVWAGIKVLRIKSVVVLKTTWTFVLLAAIAMPLLIRWQAWQPKAAVVVPVRHFIPASAAHEISPAITLLPSVAPAAEPAEQWDISRWKDLAVPAYLFVAGVLLLRIAIGLALSFRLWRRAEAASVLLDPRASVRISDDIETPVTIGSAILLPRSYEDWDRHRQHVVLAHERSHVRQQDFYLQLTANLYTALFWFSPLGWLLKKEISDLAEAISDGAALRESESEDRAGYAELLVEFASKSRRLAAGIAMARSSNIRRRVDRLLTEQKFRNAFTTCKWHLASAAMLVPAALVAAVALVRVQTADAMKLPQVVLNAPVIEAIPVSSLIPARSLARVAHVAAAMQSQTNASTVSEQSGNSSLSIHRSDNDRDSYAIVGKDSHVSGSGDFDGEFNRARNAMQGHSDYIWFTRDGKSYVIEDPGLVNQAKQYFKPMEELGRKQGEWGEQQGRLGEEQGRLGIQQAGISTQMPDISKEMSALESTLQRLKTNMQQQINVRQEDLAAIQEKLADLQARLGDAQGRLGNKQAEFGAQQSQLGEKQAKLGEQQAELGRQQEALAKEADTKMKSLIDNAMQQGKARPVD